MRNRRARYLSSLQQEGAPSGGTILTFPGGDIPREEKPDSPPLATPKWPGWLLAVIILIAMAGLHIAGNTRWLNSNCHFVNFDEIEHITNTQRYYDTLFGHGPADIVGRVNTVLHVESYIYPPLQYLLGAVTMRVFGAGDPDGEPGWLPMNWTEPSDAMSFSNTIALLLLTLGMFFVSRVFYAPPVSALIAAVVSLLPGYYGISRLPLTDLLAATAVVWGFHALLRTKGFSRTGWCLVFGVVMGLGLLTRWVGWTFLAAPISGAIIWGVHNARGDQTVHHPRGRIIANLIASLVIAAGVAAPWYAMNLGRLDAAMKDLKDDRAQIIERNLESDREAAANPESASSPERLGRAPLGPRAWMVAALNGGVFLPTFCLAVIGLAVWTALRWRTLEGALMILWLPGTLLLLYAFKGLMFPLPRYALPMLAPIGFLACAGLLAIPWRWVRISLFMVFIALLGHQYGNLTCAHWYGPRNVQAPILRNYYHVKVFENKGLIVWTNLVRTGAAARYTPPLHAFSWADHAFPAMIDLEKEMLPAGGQEARLHLLRTPPANMEKQFLQGMRFWPRLNPGENSQERVCGMVSPLTAVFPERETPPNTVKMVSSRTMNVDVLSSAPLFRDEPANAAAAPCEREIPLGASSLFDVLTFSFPDKRLTPAAFMVEYFDADQGGFVAFDPPAAFQGPAQQHHLFRFMEVNTDRIRVRYQAAHDQEGRVVAGPPACFRIISQQRPLIISNKRAEDEFFNPTQLSPYYQLSYLAVFGDPQPEDAPILNDYDQVFAGRDPMFGHPFTIFAAKRQPLVSFESNPRFQVRVSEDLYPNGRWDLPWWRLHKFDTTVNYSDRNASGQYYWATSLPAVAEVELGAVYDIQGLDILPYMPDTDIKEVTMQHWDDVAGQWRDTSPPEPLLRPAQYRNGVYSPQGNPTLWPQPVKTSRLRLTFQRDPDIKESVGYIASILPYGRPAVNEVSGTNPAAACASVFEAPRTVEAIPTGMDPAVMAGRAIQFTVEEPGEYPSQVVRFNVESSGQGAVTLAINGEEMLVFPNTMGTATLWESKGVRLAWKAGVVQTGRQNSECRLVLPKERFSSGPAMVQMRLHATDAGASFALVK